MKAMPIYGKRWYSASLLTVIQKLFVFTFNI